MFVAGLELLLCQLRRQSDHRNVIGVDLAKQLLESARTKAIQRRLGNIEFEVGDMLSHAFSSREF
jgi:Methyltransferase domain.